MDFMGLMLMPMQGTHLIFYKIRNREVGTLKIASRTIQLQLRVAVTCSLKKKKSEEKVVRSSYESGRSAVWNR